MYYNGSITAVWFSHARAWACVPFVLKFPYICLHYYMHCRFYMYASQSSWQSFFFAHRWRHLLPPTTSSLILNTERTHWFSYRLNMCREGAGPHGPRTVPAWLPHGRKVISRQCCIRMFFFAIRYGAIYSVRDGDIYCSCIVEVSRSFLMSLLTILYLLCLFWLLQEASSRTFDPPQMYHTCIMAWLLVLWRCMGSFPLYILACLIYEWDCFKEGPSPHGPAWKVCEGLPMLPWFGTQRALRGIAVTVL